MNPEIVNANPHYGRIGEAQGVRVLVDRFYDLMDEDPDYFGIRKLHPQDLGESRNKLFWFLSEWMGGPKLFAEHVGQPILRRRHAPFSIGISERDQWMGCMVRAMQDVGLEDDLRMQLQHAFFKTADFMRNRPE
ncbi:MAG: hemoglobin-like protein [Hydrogenophilales bacterium RIFOXYD1_FULL_62_11]|nr:MAG: hemoglobin-like protein [Hydrogenophilales bacterium RIFOXYD1_FULL_62_11]